MLLRKWVRSPRSPQATLLPKLLNSAPTGSRCKIFSSVIVQPTSVHERKVKLIDFHPILFSSFPNDHEFYLKRKCQAFITVENLRSCWRPSLCMWPTWSKRPPTSPTCVIARRPRRPTSGRSLFRNFFSSHFHFRMPDDLREGKDRMIFGNLESIFEWHRE